MITAFMNLTLPTVSVTIGPDWANELNAALSVIDTHDHSSGKGIKVKPSGLDITSDLDFQSNSATALNKAKFTPLNASLSGSSNSNSIYSVNGDAYFTNGSGVAVQLTTGGSIVTAPSATNLFQFNNLSSNLTIAPVDTFVAIAVDTSASRTIELPTASAVSAGRIYMIKDATGNSETNPITLNAAGGDLVEGASSLTIESDFSCTFVIGNGVDAWYII